MAYYLNNKKSLENSKGSSSVALIIVCVIVVSAILLFFFAKNRNNGSENLTEEQQLIQEAKETRKNGPAVNLTEEEKTDIVEDAQTIRRNQDVKVDISEEKMREIINQSRDIN